MFQIQLLQPKRTLCLAMEGTAYIGWELTHAHKIAVDYVTTDYIQTDYNEWKYSLGTNAANK